MYGDTERPWLGWAALGIREGEPRRRSKRRRRATQKLNTETTEATEATEATKLGHSQAQATTVFPISIWSKLLNVNEIMILTVMQGTKTRPGMHTPGSG